MAVTTYESGTMFVPISSGTPCPVCGKRDGRCSEFYLNHKLHYISCKHVPSDEPSNLSGWYIHRVGDSQRLEHVERKPLVIPDVKFTVTKEVIELRDKVYTDLKRLLARHIPYGLYEDDKKDLVRRGLSDEEIKRLGCFSVPKSSHKVSSDDGSYEMQLATYVSNKLYEKYDNDLLKVAGFMKINGKNGDYITFKTKMKDPKTKNYKDIRGYYVPYRNYKGQFVGMQYRLSEAIIGDDGKPIRYFWFSSSNASSGSPIDYIVPSEYESEDTLLVGEGALKMKIACEKLKVLGMAQAGVNNYNALVTEIQMLEIKNRVKYNVIIALDMDKNTIKTEFNGKEFYPVLDAEKKTIDLLKLTGHNVIVAEWDISKGKGIDDALFAGAEINYKPI